MGKPTGFLEYKRETAKVLPPKVRIANFNEFRTPISKEKQTIQGARCMACGVPFCQSGMMLNGMASGCPLHNLVPETNDLVYTGNWKQAYLRLSKTHSFPEFTSRVCPALCEAACTCNLDREPVSTKENERAIIETAWQEGWVKPQIPRVRTGKTIAVVGSGPSGLAAAQQLKEVGIDCTVEVPTEVDWGGQMAYLIGWGSPFDADDHTYKVFGTDKGANYSSYSNALVDQYLIEARESADPAVRAEAYDKFQEELAKDPAFTFICYIDANYVANSSIQGISADTVMGHHGVGIFWNVADWTIGN